MGAREAEWCQEIAPDRARTLLSVIPAATDSRPIIIGEISRLDSGSTPLPNLPPRHSDARRDLARSTKSFSMTTTTPYWLYLGVAPLQTFSPECARKPNFIDIPTPSPRTFLFHVDNSSFSTFITIPADTFSCRISLSGRSEIAILTMALRISFNRILPRLLRGKNP